jgi:hypothetical protein
MQGLTEDDASTDAQDSDHLRAQIGREEVVGEVIETGFDGERVLYVEDRDGQTRVVRPERQGYLIITDPTRGDD